MEKITCFVLMPFGKEGTEEHKKNKDIFENIITPAVKAANPDIECLRADMINKSGSIIKDIIGHLHKDEIVIADLSGRNANVFYELGVRQALSRRSILISRSIDDIPFDLRPYRVATYKYPVQDEDGFNKKIKEYIEDILNNPGHSDSPVSDYLPNISVGEKSERKLKVSFRSELLPGRTGNLHTYGLLIDVKNIIDKTINGINIVFKFHPALSVRGNNDFSKINNDEKIGEIYYKLYGSTKERSLQPGKTFVAKILFQVTNDIYWAGILDTKFYWEVFADDMRPLKGEDVLNKYTQF